MKSFTDSKKNSTKTKDALHISGGNIVDDISISYCNSFALVSEKLWHFYFCYKKVLAPKLNVCGTSISLDSGKCRKSLRMVTPIKIVHNKVSL